MMNEAPRRVEIAIVYARSEAIEVINRSIEDYHDRYGDPGERLSALRSLRQRIPTG